MNDTTSTDQLFLEIAKRHMPSVETLETRNRDALDFHDVAVWSIRNSLAEAQRLALDESKGRLLDVATANATIDEIASTMRDALLNWPARVSGVIAAELGVEPHLLQTILQQHINELLTEASDRFDPPGLGGE